MQTPLERAAHAVELELSKQEMVLADPLTLRRMMASRCARVVLQAIREPSEAMIDKGGDLLSELDWNLHTDCQRAEQMFGSMIDTALSTPQPRP